MNHVEDKPECLELASEVFRFVETAIISALPLNDAKESVWIELVKDASFNASVSLTKSPTLVIHVNEGAITNLFERCDELVDTLEFDNPAQIGLTYTAALIFLILHEYSHDVAGHVDYVQERLPEQPKTNLGWAAIINQEQSPNYPHFRKMSELEADGTAFALILDFADEICQSIALPNTVDAETIQRSILLGCFITVCSLDGLFDSNAKTAPEYPFAATRMINLCSSYLRVIDPNIVCWRNGDHRFMGADNSSAFEISSNYKETVVPAIFMLHQTLISRNVKSDFFNTTVETIDENQTEFMKDILAVLGGSLPIYSHYGEELTELSKHRANFMVSLENYRKLDLWI